MGAEEKRYAQDLTVSVDQDEAEGLWLEALASSTDRLPQGVRVPVVDGLLCLARTITRLERMLDASVRAYDDLRESSRADQLDLRARLDAGQKQLTAALDAQEQLGAERREAVEQCNALGYENDKLRQRLARKAKQSPAKRSRGGK